jgi:leucyl/phenylalanyl-tRNA--protein transferase
MGMAHSVEAWDANGDLVGGVYGVDAGGVFCGESMFHTETNASKLALLHIIDHLRSRGATWLDAQVMNAAHTRTRRAGDTTKRFLEKSCVTPSRVKLTLF